MVNHPNRKQTAFRLSRLERDALLAVLNDVIARLETAGRTPALLRKIRDKIANTGE